MCMYSALLCVPLKEMLSVFSLPDIVINHIMAVHKTAGNEVKCGKFQEFKSD